MASGEDGSERRRIGPYRVESRLGSGGMGEVYRGYDERLDRPVALKQIRPEVEARRQGRQRFRREARAVARLSHSAIVQVHDWVETESGDWIVMELVEGRTLRQLLADGPLAPGEAIRLARSILDGLAVAHAAGIVHRDLKAENVMVTPAGQVKILDFGLAKLVVRREGDPTLTGEGRLLGTVRAMSPEQALGWPVDHCSDLFSMGTLLYEMVTGVSPFRAAEEMATLTRICTYRQPPAREQNPEVPEALSILIDGLLEKDPARRPPDAATVITRLDAIAAPPASTSATQPARFAGLDEVAAAKTVTLARPPGRSWRRWRWPVAVAGAVMLALVAVHLLLRRGPTAPYYVAVPETEIGSATVGEPLRLVASGVRAALLRCLLSLEGISVLVPGTSDPSASHPSQGQVQAVAATPAEVARAMAADEVLSSRLACGARTCQVILSRFAGEDGRLLWVHNFEVPPDDLMLLSTSVAGHLRRAYPEHRVREGAPDLEVRGEDFAEYLRLQRSFELRPDGFSAAQLEERLAAIRATSPRFLEAYLLQARVAHDRFLESRDPADLEDAFGILRQARELAPGNPQPLLRLFKVALDGERLEEAAAALQRLVRLEPGDATVLARQALLVERQGRPQEALTLMRTAADRQPSWPNLFDLAAMEYRQGEIPAARLHLRQLLERSPGNFRGQRLLAQIELLNGSPEKAAELYQELAERVPGMTVLTNLGMACLLLNRYAEAVDSFRRALELEPKAPFAALNLADAELLSGRKEEAEALYRRVLALIDPAASNWQSLTVRAQALAHLGQVREAVMAIQEALQLAPNNPQAAYEAALVYVLVGDQASARVNAEKALELGTEPRWFSFPWFDSLRTDPTFQALLKLPTPVPQ